MKKLWIGVLVMILMSTSLVNAQRYVVIMKESFEAPLKKTGRDNPNRLRKESENRSNRNQKSEKVRGYAKNKGIDVPPGKLFVDGAVGFISELSMAQVNNLKSDPEVFGVYPDFTIQSTRPMMQSRPMMQGETIPGEVNYNPTLKASCAIPLMGGSKSSRTNSSIWILDSGVDGSHIDLNVSTNSQLSVSFVEGENNPLTDVVGHGTHCAGLAAGIGSGTPGVTGMSPGAEVISVKVLDNQGGGTWSQLILALDHVAKYGIRGDVVLMSLGSGAIENCENSDPIIRNMIQDLGNDQIFVVMSAGNDSQMANQNLPGCVNGQNVITVGAVDFECTSLGGLATYSNFGTPSIDFLAPGTNVFSSFPNNQYQVMSGSSMSAALVAGLIHSEGRLPNTGGTIQLNGFTYPVAKR
jgi:subtilisin family serine protease